MTGFLSPHWNDVVKLSCLIVGLINCGILVMIASTLIRERRVITSYMDIMKSYARLFKSEGEDLTRTANQFAEKAKYVEDIHKTLKTGSGAHPTVGGGPQSSWEEGAVGASGGDSCEDKSPKY